MSENERDYSSRIFLTCTLIVIICILLLVGRGIKQKRQAEQALLQAESGCVSTELVPDDVSDYLFSPVYGAVSEWESYQKSYDPDGSKLSEAMGSEELGQGYTLYRVYTSEMALRLDKLCAERQLTLNRSMSFFYSTVELYATAGTGEFLEREDECVGYLFDSGSFHLDSNFRSTDFRFDLQKKNAFSETALLTPSVEDEQWVYISHGKPLLLSLGREYCLIHTALRGSYITVTVPFGAADTEGAGISGAFLESLADSIHWERIEG